VPGPTLTTDALVLHRQPPTETFQTFTVFTPDHGALRILQRLPGKKPSAAHLALDLFDDVSLLLEGTPSGDAWFVKEARLHTRHAGIGKRYETLLQASAFAQLAARNPGSEESYPAIHALLRTAFTAFATSDRPDIVYLKSLYCFARDEGYAVKQHWFPSLPAADRPLAIALINQPLASQTTSPPDVTRLLRSLETYVRQHTEIHLD
jgi:recombinational DNA repair protein (RecF pathway)